MLPPATSSQLLLAATAVVWRPQRAAALFDALVAVVNGPLLRVRIVFIEPLAVSVALLILICEQPRQAPALFTWLILAISSLLLTARALSA